MLKKIIKPFTSALCFIISAFITSATFAAEQADFTGVWEAYAAVRGNSSPMLPEGQQLVDNFSSQFGDNYVEPGSYCVPPGLVGIMTAMVSYPVEVIHSEDRVTMLTEYDMQVRRIFMDGREVPDNHPTTGMGYSIGHWENNQLVIETSLLSEYLLGGWPLSENTVVTERIYNTTRDEAGVEYRGFVQPTDYSNDVLVFELSIEDSTFWTEPQEITMYYQRLPDDSFLEYVCPADLWRRALNGVGY
jgi:hypothetical protein